MGLSIGFLGTILGLGGGFILVPLLLYAWKFTVPRAVGTSHFVITLNAFSGAWAYDRQRKIDYRIALSMAGTAIPAAFAATLVVRHLSSPWFRIIFAATLVLGAIYIFKRQEILGNEHVSPKPHAMTWAMIASLFSGFAAGMLGVGGGIFHVPILCILLGLPIHRATATSHFILLLSSLVAASSLALQGCVDLVVASWLGVGVIIGAQAGARVSPYVRESAIKKAFAVAVLLAAGKMFWDGWRMLMLRAS